MGYSGAHTVLNFENWSSGDQSKIGHQFRKKIFTNWRYQKISITKNVHLNWYSSKIETESNDFGHRKLSLALFDTFPINPIRKIQKFPFCIFRQNLSNFGSSAWKLDNPYYHTCGKSGKRTSTACLPHFAPWKRERAGLGTGLLESSFI